MKSSPVGRVVRVLCVFLLFIAESVRAQVTGAAAEIPNSAFGTWELTMEGATSRSPFPNETSARLTIAIDGSICSDGFLVKTPTMKAGDSTHIYWTESGNNLEFSISTDKFEGFAVASATGTSYGFFRAAEEPSANDCDINQRFFDLAESKYPLLFPEGVFVLTHMTSSEFYRYYSSTDTLLLIRDGQASAMGGNFGGVPVPLGSVSALITSALGQISAPPSVLPVQLPSPLIGTYRMTFAAAGSFSPIAGGTAVDVAITEQGNLCLNGTLYTDPVLDVSNAAFVSWRNTLTGFVIRLNTTTASASALQLQLQTLKGEVLGTMTGSKTQLLAQCAGLVAGNVKIAAVNELFNQAELYYPAVFPPSVLTYNQLTDGSITRYYPTTGVLVTVTGDNVQVRGGVYGNANRTLGTVDALLARIRPNSPQAAVAVTGSLAFKQGGLPTLNRKVEFTQTVAMPTDTSTNAALAQAVAQVLASELNGTSTYTFSNVTSTATKLEFTVRITNSTTIAGTVVARNYDLHFIYNRL